MPADPHKEFQELCALSTTGELTAEEWARLTGHLVHCDSCPEAKRQYEALITTTIPALGAESLEGEDGEDAPGFFSLEEAEATLMETLRREPTPPLTRPVAHPVYRPLHPGWNRVFVFAAAAAILTACSLTGYRIGVHNGRNSKDAAAPAGPIASKLQPRPNPSLTVTTPAHDEKIAPADDQAAALRKRTRLDQGEIAGLNDQLNKLERELADRSADLDRSVEERADLNRKLAEAQSNALSLDARISLIGKETSEDTQQALALKGQVNGIRLSNALFCGSGFRDGLE
jgi:hypothetical protein